MTKVWFLPALSFLAVTAMIAVGSIGHPLGTSASASGAQEGEVTLTLLHNNDGESKLLPAPESGFPGIARFTQALQDLGTATSSDILLRVTSGDNFLASKEFAAGLDRNDAALYDSIALSGLYEAMALGNHDFDFGPEVTARFIDGFDPGVPFLSANLDVSAEPSLAALQAQGRIARSTIFADPTSGERIGIIGATTPRLPNISSPRDVRVDPDVAAAVNAEALVLTNQGIDRIVLVSHLQSLSADRELVPQLSGVDIVVAGGGDELLKNDGDTCMPDDDAAGPYPLVISDLDDSAVPVVTGPGGYRCIGQLDVTFDSGGKAISWSGNSIGVDLDGKAEQYVVDEVERPLEEALADLKSTIVGSSEVDLDGRKPSVRTGPTNVGELLASALLSAGQAAPDFGGTAAHIAIQNGGGIRNDAIIAAGDISTADTFDIAPFANFVVTTEVERSRLKQLLEGAVAGLPDAEGQFPQVAGFTMKVDPSQAAREVDTEGDCSLIGATGSRVRDLTLEDGTRIVAGGNVIEGPPVVLATIDFLAGGGDCYPLDDLDVTKVGLSYQQALASFIADSLDGEVSAIQWPTEGNNITFIETTTNNHAASSEVDVEEPIDDLPKTGVESWMWAIAAFTLLAGGLMIYAEARRASVRSLSRRLVSTAAWDPRSGGEDEFLGHL